MKKGEIIEKTSLLVLIVAVVAIVIATINDKIVFSSMAAVICLMATIIYESKIKNNQKSN